MHPEIRNGILFAIAAFTIWGFSPIYFKAIAAVAPVEIVCHRVIWSVFFLALFLFQQKKWHQVKILFTNKRTQTILLCTSLLIGGNWLILRKKVSVDTITGLFFETIILLPAAIVYLVGFSAEGLTAMTNYPLSFTCLLIMAGLVTTVPLLCFTAAAARLRLSTLGFFQYLGPSLMFLLALTVYDEPFRIDSGITFVFIWTALSIFTFDALRRNSKPRQL